MGGRYNGLTEKERQREVTNEKRTREEGEQQNLFRLSSSTLQKFFCFPPDERLQNFLGPQADACFGATPVPNVGKSSALLMSGAWNKQIYHVSYTNNNLDARQDTQK